MADVPPSLELVEAFLNSVDVEGGADDLASVEHYERWLRAHHRDASGTDEASLRDARQLRDALREVTRAHHDGAAVPPDAEREALDELAARVRLRARFGTEGVRLESGEAGARRVLGEVLAAVVVAAGDGTWARMKICGDDTCQWIFYDQSKNSSKQWCSMRVCGNRNKTRAYRARQRA